MLEPAAEVDVEALLDKPNDGGRGTDTAPYGNVGGSDAVSNEVGAEGEVLVEVIGDSSGGLERGEGEVVALGDVEVDLVLQDDGLIGISILSDFEGSALDK